ncbi:MAG TPA: FtsX-like permease family protein [Vicinamibacterales bacterium]
MPLFRWFILRRLRQEPVRTTLTVAGIALGVAVGLAIRLANASATAGFAASLDAVAGRTSLEIVGPGVGVSEARLASLGWLREWGEVSPVIEGDAVAEVGGGRGELLRVLGADILRDQSLREYRLLDLGGGGDAEPDATSFLRLLVDRDAIVIAERFAGRHRLGIGDTLVLRIGDARLPFTVRGILRHDGPARAADGSFALMDIAAAQLAFGRLGWVDRIDIRLDDPGRLEEAETAIAARLPGGLAVQRPERRGRQVETMLAAFQFNLAALSWIALLVGLFLVYNTVSTSVIARRAEVGMLRALGTSRRRVLGLFLGEATALAIAGSAIGIPLGRLFAETATALTSATVTTLYVARAAATPSLHGVDVVIGFAVGVPLSLLAAAAPAIEASRVAPLDALRPPQGGGAEPRSRRAAWCGIALLALAAGASRLGPVNGLPIFGFGAALLVLLGLSLLVPAALAGLTARLPPVTVEARLARAAIAAAVPRLSISVAALAVSLAMMVAIAVLVGSFRETVIYWTHQTLRADLFVSAGRRSSLDGSQGGISPELETTIRLDPDVAAVDPFRALSVTFRDRLVVLGSGDFDVLLEHGALVFKAPADATARMRRARGRDAVVVSEAFARRFALGPGDHVDLPTPEGERRFEIAAVYYDYSTDRGVAVMDRGTFARHFGELRPASLAIYLREGADPEAVRERLLSGLGGRHRVFLRTNAALRAEVLRIFDATFAITYALELVAIVVAMLGVTATLVTLMLERRRELAVLRLVGTDLRQLRRMVLVEAAVLGGSGALAGLAGGLALSLILVYVINVQSFGWTIQFHVPAAFLAQALLIVFAATLVAGLYPARVAAGFMPAREVAVE